MELYNTKTRKKETFKPLHEREVKVYHCGPTVYNYVHIGNLKTYVWNDIITRTLRFLGFNLKVMMNITDIDDKTIRGSLENNMTLKIFTENYTKIFLEDIEKLNIIKPDIIEPISNVIPEMVRMINTLLRRWFAYLWDDKTIYFKISKFGKYWKLANLDMKWLKKNARIDNDEYDKDNASDFALWKAWSEWDWENYWEDEFEIDWKKIILKWRPGWHIECSACNMKHFGQQIDLHTWGIDNLFPHHQNEVAQTEACTRKEFSKYWAHHGHLMVDSKKMSKSAWNFYTLEDLEKIFLDKVSSSVFYRSIRFGFINWKYRDSINFNFDKLEASFNTIKSIDETLKLVDREIKSWEKELVWISRDFRDYMQEILQEYVRKLEDDFNVPEALAVFFTFIKYINSWIKNNEFALEELISLMDMFKTFDSVLWIFDFSILKETEIPDEVLNKLELRNQAKNDKNFELSDKLRDEITEAWYKIIDSKEGSRVEKI